MQEETTLTLEIRSTLVKWREESEKLNLPLELYLGVDIGGTNTRVAVINEFERSKRSQVATGTEESYVQLIKFKANTVHDLITKLRLVGQQFAEATKCKPITACLAVAGPVTDNGTQVSLTNYTGEKLLRTSDLPAILFPIERTRFINDLASTCFGINALSDENHISTYFSNIFGQDSSEPKLEPTNYLVLAMGTGLGVGLLTANYEGTHDVLPLEAGHSTITTVGPVTATTHEEKDLLDFLSHRIYQGQHNIEWEDICSGRGLVACYEWVVRNNPSADRSLDAAAISRRAIGEAADPNAQQALFLHYKYLFRAAQQHSVTLNARGLFLAGDNQVYNNPFVQQHIKEYQEEFLSHTKQNWIQGSPCYVQTQSYNLNLLGTLFMARRMGVSYAQKIRHSSTRVDKNPSFLSNAPLYVTLSLPFAAGALLGGALIAALLKK